MSALFEVVRAVEYDDETGTLSPNVLLERTTAGLTVQVAYLPTMDMVTLTARMGDEQVACTVEPSKALDAFDHPVLYLSEAQCELLGVR